MKIACLGAGPAGLYFAISMKLRDAAHDITVFERNRPDDTFGWGTVLSDETFDNLSANDSVSADAIRKNFAYWDDIAVHYRGQRIVSTGHGLPVGLMLATRNDEDGRLLRMAGAVEKLFGA